MVFVWLIFLFCYLVFIVLFMVIFVFLGFLFGIWNLYLVILYKVFEVGCGDFFRNNLLMNFVFFVFIIYMFDSWMVFCFCIN